MNAAEALCMARENGVRVDIAGTDLILDANQEPASLVLEALRRHKVGIVALLTVAERNWTAEDWGVFYNERAGIAEFDGELPRPEAEIRAFECCIIEWLNRNPQHSNLGRCARCGEPDRDRHAVVPFGAESRSHTLLHPDCWPKWFPYRRQMAIRALVKIGIRPAIRGKEKGD